MNKYISLIEILDNLLEHPLLKDLSLERAINYTVHFMRIVGCPKLFQETTSYIEIKNYRGLLPCNLENVIQVRTKVNNDNYQTFRYSTDSFHMSNDKPSYSDLTYKLQDNVIFTSLKEGTIEVAYKAFKVDENGYPMIPDNSSFIRALELFIKKQCFTVLFDLGKINAQVYNNVLQEYAFAVGQAQSELVKFSIDEAESFSNSINTLVSRTNEHKTGFVNNGNKEYIKLK